MKNFTIQEQTQVVQIGPYKMRCYDPHGFWRIEDEEEGSQETVPEGIRGYYTTPSFAAAAYKTHMATVEAKTEKPVAKVDHKKKPKEIVKVHHTTSNIFS